jgi:predicted nucleic acid-binding protein
MSSKVYIETSVISYLVARPSRDLITAAHQQLTQEWWQNRRGDFALYASQLVIQEAGAGEAEMAQKRLVLLEKLPLLDLSEACIDLGRLLVSEGPIPEKAAVDALHIAVSTVHGVDYLLTWNCKHIANAEMQTAVTAICRSAGYEPPVICTPEELLGS